MAIYSGFFDAAFDERTGTYDREYDSVDFTGYFGAFVGSGVCVHGNDESMKVHLDTNTKKVLVNPGYLFIRGYWLKNTTLYPIGLSGLSSGTHAIYAKLNLGKRMIEMGHTEKTEAYPDTLVLAYVTISDGMLSIEDTRSNTKICGLIDSSGSLSVKVEFALNYINTQVENKLNQIEQNLKEQQKVIAGKIEEANSLIAKIAPPAIGTIKFSASQSVEEGWIPCDGRFVNERDYPELVAALGKLTPSGDKFRLLSDGEIGQKITNAVVFAGRVWVYSYTTKKLYGVDVNDKEEIKEITIHSSDSAFSKFANPTPTSPIILSIAQAGSVNKLFLSQVLKVGSIQISRLPTQLENYLSIFEADFTGVESSLDLKSAVHGASITLAVEIESSSNKAFLDPGLVIPYIIPQESTNEFLCMFALSHFSESIAFGDSGALYYTFGSSKSEIAIFRYPYNYEKAVAPNISGQRVGFNPKNKGESVYIFVIDDSTEPDTTCKYKVISNPSGLFSSDTLQSLEGNKDLYTGKSSSICIAGDTGLVYGITLKGFKVVDTRNNKILSIEHTLNLPSAARTFHTGGLYLFGKAIYMIFIGTGILFFREFTNESIGYLDTTSVLGTITQYGYLDYSQDENTLYLVGQDTNNKVKVAKMVLNTLFDYANDGAWLPAVAADGVPAYIKAKEV